jgi:hypothetical protein
VPWQLIGERVAVTVAAGEVRIANGVREVARCPPLDGQDRQADFRHSVTLSSELTMSTVSVVARCARIIGG